MTEPITNQDKLDEIYELMKETHDMMRDMKRRETIAKVFQLIYFAIVIASLGGVYYFISPLIDPIMNSSSKIQEFLQHFNEIRNNIPESAQFDKAIETLKGTSTQ